MNKVPCNGRKLKNLNSNSFFVDAELHLAFKIYFAYSTLDFSANTLRYDWLINYDGNFHMKNATNVPYE